jgi:type IV pilus assembly protein PilC
VIGLLVIGVFQAIRLRPAGRLALSRALLRVPILGDTLRKIAVSRVARTASTLLENGVALLPALQTAAKTAGSLAIEHVFLDVADAVSRGHALSEPLRSMRFIPPLAAQILSTGEETASMGQMFGKLADFYEAEADATVGIITSILEPALVVVMGIVVAGILIALYLPMFDVLGQIGG